MKTSIFSTKMARAVGIAGLMAFSSTGFSAAFERHVLDFGDRLVRGETQVGIKKEARDRGIILRDNELVQVLLVAKSRGGGAVARLVDGGSGEEVTIPGTPDKFDDHAAYTYSKLSIDANNMAGNTPWRLLLRGQIKIKEIILIASKEVDDVRNQLDFGGMYGLGTDSASRPVQYKNPLTGAMSCPAGFTVVQASGVPEKDYYSYYCIRPLVAGQPRTLLFGGMYGGGEGNPYRYPNPVTGTSSCPAGYQAHTVRSAINVDWNQSYCYKVPSHRNEKSVLPFAGLIGTRPDGRGGAAYYANPITGNGNCPVGFRKHQIYGTRNQDWAMSLCVPN